MEPRIPVRIKNKRNKINLEIIEKVKEIVPEGAKKTIQYGNKKYQFN